MASSDLALLPAARRRPAAVGDLPGAALRAHLAPARRRGGAHPRSRRRRDPLRSGRSDLILPKIRPDAPEHESKSLRNVGREGYRCFGVRDFFPVDGGAGLCRVTVVPWMLLNGTVSENVGGLSARTC